jgi:phage tail sheath protein FI
MLLIDPPTAWDTPAAAVESVRRWPLHSEDALMFYPRLLAFDRLRGRYEQFGSAAASAGLLARSDQVCPVWSVSDAEEPMLRPGLRPSASVTELDRARLAQGGVNVLASTRHGGRGRGGLRTLLPEMAAKSDWRTLASRRFALFIMASIERGTRWVRFEHGGPPLWALVRAQVMAFFEALERDGAFVGRTTAENYYVVCDRRLNTAADVACGRFQLLFGFATLRPGEFQSYLVTQHPDGGSARAASVNRYALPRQS